MYIEYDGIKFYKENNGVGYYHSGKHGRLHRYIWEKYNGEIPKGYHVHHKDHNPDNNDISNLELLSAHEHLSEHSSEPQRKEWSRQNLNEKARPAACIWHGSEEGRAWHREHAKTTLGKYTGETVSKVCEVCGKEFEAPYLCANRNRFCSNNCKSAFRRASGVDNVERPCLYCGKIKIVNKYSVVKFCNAECASKYRREHKSSIQ